MSPHAGQVVLETDLTTVFDEMERGNHLEPSDDEFERAVQRRALSLLG